ncbi:transglycosylase family protein [Tessaracoccus massiliensis]|uniref:transglycosylase family protein n=1 Tax=Tessaracoccus massiliensis TaxID=1522311 RepID=UPI0006947D68|nr:transglycosylase family protein [Tessaracoccus massiliensis]
MLKRLLAAASAAVVGLGLAIAAPQAAHAVDVDQYTTPGDHLVNGRYWKTECELYSSTVVRCSTDIWAPKVVTVQGQHVLHEGWVFNNMTYLPSARGAWKGNPLATNRTWTAEDGRQWRTECDTAATGRNGCRTYALTTVVAHDDGKFVSENQWQFNNIVQFTAASTPAVTSIPAAAPPLANVPVEKPAVLPVKSQLNLARAATWDRIARCESGNRWNINTGNGYYGGLQFNLATWRSVGGTDFAAYPHHATREEQITVANRLHAKRGFQPWSCKP